jgi:hypothetical protein
MYFNCIRAEHTNYSWSISKKEVVELCVHNTTENEGTRMSELSRMFFRSSMTPLHCKERLYLAKFGVVPTLADATEARRWLVSSVPASGFSLPCVSHLRLNNDKTQSVLFLVSDVSEPNTWPIYSQAIILLWMLFIKWIRSTA